MAMPTTTVEVAFPTDPGATPTWTDVSAYLVGFSVHRGRPDELSGFNAGQATITFANEDRRFDPSYTSSPYYPNVVPMRRIRIRATYNAVTYDVFNGYVSNWQQQYQPPQAATCVVAATDAFKVLNSITLPRSVYVYEVTPDAPVLWWSLGEPSGSTRVLDRSGNLRDGTPRGSVSLGASGLISRDPDSAAGFTQSANTNIEMTGSALTLDQVTPWAIEFWFRVPSPGGATWSLVTSQDWVPGGTGTLSIQYDNVSGLSFTVLNSGGTDGGFINTVYFLTANQIYHLVFTYDSDRKPRVYVNGTLVGTAATAGTGTFSLTKFFLGGWSLAPNGTIDEFAIYKGGGTTALSTARIAVHATAGSAPWLADLTGTRIGKLLDVGGWPAADRSLGAGTSTLQTTELGLDLLSAVQEVEQTEFGALFVTAGGLVKFVGRDQLLKGPYTTSQATFGDTGSDLEYADLTYEYDDDLIVNEVTVSRADGAMQTVSDSASQTRYLRRSLVIDGLLHQSDTTSRDAANWILTHYKDPILRVTGLRLESSAGNDTTHFPQALGRELLDRVTVKRLPQNLGAAISQDVMIQGITHQVSAVQWVTTWNLSPAETQVYWILGTAGFGELGQTTRLGF